MARVGGYGLRTIRELFGVPGQHTIRDWGGDTGFIPDVAPLVEGTVVDASGASVVGASVALTLMKSHKVVTGHAPAFDRSITSSAYLTTDGEGKWRAVMVPNASVLFPTGTLYRVTERFGRRLHKVYLITVPSSSSVQRAEDLVYGADIPPVTYSQYYDEALYDLSSYAQEA